MRKESSMKTSSAASGYLKPAFLICVFVLALAAGGMSIATKVLDVHLEKEPLPLKQSLDLLDESKLTPYRVLVKGKIENEDVIETLGTQDYIQWQLEDTSVGDDSPVRYFTLFITYYEKPDNVPHVPEECYVGGGFQKISSEGIEVNIHRETGDEIYLARYLVFAGTNSEFFGRTEEFPVMYIFNVNGKYASGRNDARMMLNKNLFSKHSYFTKIEWKFFNEKFGGFVYPEKETAISASEKMLNVFLPVLESGHWPDVQMD